MRPPQDCRRCALCEGRTNVVRPDGDPNSPIALVGEAPGAEEDKAGRPFVGRSGKVLTKILEEGGLPRSKVFITNTVKCRPPNNRPPTAAEMEACWPCLEEELEGRRVIVALGRSAAKDLLKRDVSLAREANRPTKVTIKGKEIALIPAYHPAASFYDPRVKESLRETVRIAKAYAGTYPEGPGISSSTGT